MIVVDPCPVVSFILDTNLGLSLPVSKYRYLYGYGTTGMYSMIPSELNERKNQTKCDL